MEDYWESRHAICETKELTSANCNCADFKFNFKLFIHVVLCFFVFEHCKRSEHVGTSDYFVKERVGSFNVKKTHYKQEF